MLYNYLQIQYVTYLNILYRFGLIKLVQPRHLLLQFLYQDRTVSMFARCIDFASFYDCSNGLCNYADNVLSFFFSILFSLSKQILYVNYFTDLLQQCGIFQILFSLSKQILHVNYFTDLIPQCSIFQILFSLSKQILHVYYFTDLIPQCGIFFHFISM